MGPIEYQQDPQLYTVLRDPQASWVCQVPSALQDGWDGNQKPQESWNSGCLLYTSPSPWKRGCQGKSASPCTTGPLEQQLSAQLFFFSVVSGHLEYAIAHQHPETGKAEARPSGSPPEKSECWTTVPSSPFLPEENGELGVSFQLCVALCQGRDSLERVPGIFLLALMGFWHLPWM